MALVDTNCNPDDINFVVPGNDDSAKSIKLFCRLISDAIIAGIKENMIAQGLDISKIDTDNITSNINELKKKDEKTIRIEKKFVKKSDENSADNSDDSEKKVSKKPKSNDKSSTKTEVKVVTKKPTAKKTEEKK
jgi:small subunit ribosomal protein S2